MKLALMVRAASEEEQAVCAQLGVKYAITKAAPELTGLDAPDNYEALKTIKERFDAKGITLYGLEGDEFDMSRIKLGLEGRDEDIERYKNMVRNMGKLGLKLLCYNFMAGIGWFRSSVTLKERGNAITCGYKRTPEDEKPFIITPEQVYENYKYFLERVLPVAEEAGVKLGLHPDDPPVRNLKGYGRFLCSADDYRKVLSLSNSKYHGVTFCQATFNMMGEQVYSLMEEWGERIFFLHIRDAKGNAQDFRETFHDNGPTDMVKMLSSAAKYCPECVVRPDHTPTMAGEGDTNTGYTLKGNIFAIGYIRGICEAAKLDID